MANLLYAKRNAPPIRTNWVWNFIKQQPELRTWSFRRYDYQRARCKDPIVINAWFSLMANIITKYSIRSDDTHNFDKTGFMMGIIASRMVIIGIERHGNPKKIQPRNHEWVIVI
jgi:hypothetical protein